MINHTKWRGITYFPLFDHSWIRAIWKWTFCRKGWHLFDEVMSVDHYLYCDACGLTLEIYKSYYENDNL